MNEKRKQQEALKYWQLRIEKAKSEWDTQVAQMNRREAQYAGDRNIRALVAEDKLKESQHVWNITAENIESIVSSSIPMPKVTPRREKDRPLALIIEHMLRNEMDRLPMENINDIQERTCPIQGGTLYLTEWDNAEVSGDRVGEVVMTAIHPKMFIPQAGVYSDIEDMDFFGLRIPQSKGYIKRRYGVDVSGESESDPQVKGAGTEGSDSSEDMVTLYTVYFRNEDGTIGRISWVNDKLVEYLEDYQARHKRRCAKCDMAEDAGGLILSRPTEDGNYPEGAETGKKAEKGVCAFCGSRSWVDSAEDEQELFSPKRIGGQKNGVMLGGSETKLDEMGNSVSMATARVPFYKPKTYPLVLQKNVSVYGQLLGDSDADKIADQQNTINRLEQKIADRIMKAGSRVSLPPDTNVSLDPQDSSVWRLSNVADKQCIEVYEFTGNLQYEMAYLAQVYEESRRILGITDSFQGRKDTTATSGTAKQFAAAQSAGRMESRRVMKHAAYAKIFEQIFKLMLAYSDEPRPVYYRDEQGQTQYEEFNRYDFMEPDGAGGWRYNTDFLFSVDDSGGLASNRPQMWQELTAQLQSGAMGDPRSMDTLIDYWGMMEALHYPMAGQMRQRLVERAEKLRLEQNAQNMIQTMGAGVMPELQVPTEGQTALPV